MSGKELIIRSNWKQALEQVEHGYELSADIGYGFSDSDLIVLCCLHERGLYQDKIEELLTDCNFHRERKFLTEGQYENYKQLLFA